MFVLSVRASTIKFFSVIIVSLLVLGIILFGGGGRDITVSASADGINLAGIKTEEDRVRFISDFGIEVKPGALEVVEFSVPGDFDKIIKDYNEIQKMQGLDLSRYKNKKVTRYTYEAEGVSGHEGVVFVNLIIYRSTVIACDVSGSEPDGFVEPLIKLG